MEKAKFVGVAPQLIVKDVVRTAGYYGDVLGFNIIRFVLDPPVYAMVERDGFQIHFGKADADAIPVNEHFRKIGYDVIIWVPEIDRFFEEVSERKGEITQEIVRRAYGSREFVIRDCDGHKILVTD
jgi:predicted enzyme related to lactoylglutathione lyase